MKILIVMTPSFNPTKGGVQRITEKLGKYFAKQNHEVFYYCFSATDNIIPEYGTIYFQENEEGITPRNLAYLHEVLNSIRPDVVMNQMPYEKTITSLLGKLRFELKFWFVSCLNNSLFSVKNNLDQYCSSIFGYPFSKLFSNALGHTLLLQYHKHIHSKNLKFIIDNSDCFVLPTGSDESREELKYFIGNYGSGKVRGIPNSIPANTFIVDMPKEKILLYVGRLDVAQKRTNLLMPVWKIVSEALPDWRFDIVGDGPNRAMMEQEIIRMKLDRVSFHGFADPTEFYVRSTIFVMPSAFEGFPSVLLEAQSYGVVPVVFNSYPAVKSIINDEVDGLLAPAYNVNEIADKIIRVAKDEVFCDNLKRAGVENALKYRIEFVGELWLELFENKNTK